MKEFKNVKIIFSDDNDEIELNFTPEEFSEFLEDRVILLNGMAQAAALPFPGNLEDVSKVSSTSEKLTSTIEKARKPQPPKDTGEQ